MARRLSVPFAEPRPVLGRGEGRSRGQAECVEEGRIPLWPEPLRELEVAEEVCTDRQRIPDDEAGLLFRQDHVDRLSADLLDALERAFVDDGFLLPSEAWASTVCARLDFCDIYDFAPLRAPKDGARGYKRPWVTANYCWWAPPGFFFSRRPHCGGGAGAWQDRWIHPVKTTCASALSCDPSDRSREGLHCLFPDKAKPSDAEWPKTGYDDAARRAYADMFEKKQAPTKARDAPRRKKATPEKAARGKRDAAEPS